MGNNNSVLLQDVFDVLSDASKQDRLFLDIYIPTVGIKKEGNMIEVKRAMKQYGNQTVLEECSMTVEKGTIYALVGVNGAGKTTLMKLIAGFLEPTMGAVSVKGMPVWSNKEKIQRYMGSLIETPVFYEHLSARENLKLHLAYMDAKADIEGMLEIVGLGQINEKPVSTFSMGMRQRLAIARTLLHRPELLILDEPFNGLDPVAADEMKIHIRACADEGMTVLISSHILSDVSKLADVVGILAEKKIQKEFLMDEFREKKQGEFEQEVLYIMKGGTV